MNKCNIALFSWWSIIALILVLSMFVCTADAAEGYNIQLDGSVLYDSGNIVYGLSTFEGNDGIKYLTSDYPGDNMEYQGTYWSTQSPSPLSGRFYNDCKIFLGKDTDHYIGMKPVGIFYINNQDPTERQQLISLTSMTLSVNNNIVTYSQGPVDIVFTNSFSRIKGDVIFPNALPSPAVPNPALAVVWEIIGHAGINTDDGEKSTWWFEEAKAAFPIGDIQNNGSAVLNKKIFRQNGKIYLVEGVGYNWISDVNRTDSHFIIDPIVQYNDTNNWAGLSGTMREHGDGNLRAPPNVTTGLISYWNPGTDVGSGNTLTDIWGVNEGVISGAAWNISNGLDFDGNDIVSTNTFTDNLSQSSYSAWIYIPNSSASHNGRVFDKEGNVILFYSDFQYVAGYGNKSLSFYHSFSGTPGQWYTQSNTIIENTWYYVSVTYDNTNVVNNPVIYIDGVAQTIDERNTPIGTASTSAADYTIGNRDVLDRGFVGTINDTRMWNRIISQSETNQTRDNHHANSSFMETDSPIDAGAGQVWNYITISGIDAGINTTRLLQVNGSHDNVTFNGWETVSDTYNLNDIITVPIANEYRYVKIKFYQYISYQPDTDIINQIELVSSAASIEDIEEEIGISGGGGGRLGPAIVEQPVYPLPYDIPDITIKTPIIDILDENLLYFYILVIGICCTIVSSKKEGWEVVTIISFVVVVISLIKLGWI